MCGTGTDAGLMRRLHIRSSQNEIPHHNPSISNDDCLSGVLNDFTLMAPPHFQQVIHRDFINKWNII